MCIEFTEMIVRDYILRRKLETKLRRDSAWLLRRLVSNTVDETILRETICFQAKLVRERLVVKVSSMIGYNLIGYLLNRSH